MPRLDSLEQTQGLVSISATDIPVQDELRDLAGSCANAIRDHWSIGQLIGPISPARAYIVRDPSSGSEPSRAGALDGDHDNAHAQKEVMPEDVVDGVLSDPELARD